MINKKRTFRHILFITAGIITTTLFLFTGSWLATPEADGAESLLRQQQPASQPEIQSSSPLQPNVLPESVTKYSGMPDQMPLPEFKKPTAESGTAEPKAAPMGPGASGGTQGSSAPAGQAMQDFSGLLSDEEIKEIKDKALKYRKSIETENVPSGIIRSVYIDQFHIYKVKTSVNYSTVLQFPDKLSLKDVVIGSNRFIIDIYGEKSLLVFPTSPFKTTNLTVFFKGSPVHFLLEEEAQAEHCDYRVDIHETSRDAPTVGEMLAVLLKNFIPDNHTFRSAEATLQKAKCGNPACKNIELVLELKRPYMRGYKIKGNVKTKGASYEAKHGDYTYVFYPTPSGKVYYEGSEYEIF